MIINANEKLILVLGLNDRYFEEYKVICDNKNMYMNIIIVVREDENHYGFIYPYEQKLMYTQTFNKFLISQETLNQLRQRFK